MTTNGTTKTRTYDIYSQARTLNRKLAAAKLTVAEISSMLEDVNKAIADGETEPLAFAPERDEPVTEAALASRGVAPAPERRKGE